jgi:hypothetical protein
VYQQQEQQQEQQDAENPFLDPPFSRIKIEPPKAYFVHRSKLAIPGTSIVQLLFLSPEFSWFFYKFCSRLYCPVILLMV